MGFVARSRRKMWFGTEEYATWIPTPNSGADSSPQAWNETGTFLGGDGYVIGSRNSHKQYVYEWPSSSTREDAQLMKSFYEGAYGRGKLYFVEPLIYDTNVLPAKWANPAITCGFEGPSLVPGVDPVELTRADVVGGFFDLVGVQEPLTGALYNLTDVPGPPATFTPVYENLFTNPRLKGDGTWAEVRRNICTRPVTDAGGPSPFNLQGAVNWGGTLPSRTVVEVPDAPSGATNVSQYLSPVMQTTVPATDLLTTGSFPVVVGQSYTASYFCKPSVSMSVRCQIQWLTSAGASAGVSTKLDLTLPPNEWTRVDVTGVAPGTAVSARIDMDNHSANVLPAGFTLQVDGVMLEGSSILGPYFDGSTPDFSVDPDMRQRWLGTPNESESVMEIEQVRGFGGINAIPGVSSWEGKPAVRVIASADSTASLVTFGIPSGARANGVLLGESHVLAPLDAFNANARFRLSVGSPYQYAPEVPNEPGDYPQRLIFSDLSAEYIARLGHGGRQGSGDVWWTDIGLFAGDYDGPAFSGSDGSVTIDGIPYSTRWVGASDVSVSQAGIWTLDDNITLDDRNSVFIPIPEGMQLNIGANSREVGSDSPGIYLKPITDTPSNDIYKVGQASRSNLFPLVIPAKNGIRGVRMWIGKLGDSGNPSYVAVNFIHARLSPIGKPPTGPSHWIGGQGHAGTRFALPPTYISNTGVGGGQISYAATFKESLI